MEIEKFDDAKMRECLLAVQTCFEDMKQLCARYNLPKKYETWSEIEFCLDMRNSARDRNVKFNEIYLKIDTLLTKMQNYLDFIISKMDANESTQKAALDIKTADDLLNAVVESSIISRKKAQEEETEREGERLRMQKSYDIYYHNYGMDSMDFFYDKCLEYLQYVKDMRLNSEWMKDEIRAFQQQCGEMSLQLETAKQTENGLNEWKKNLFDTLRTLEVARHAPNAVLGESGDYRVLQDINRTLETCRKVITEMLRILNPDEEKYKVWYAPPDRAQFLREIGFLDDHNERQHGGTTRALLRTLKSFEKH